MSGTAGRALCASLIEVNTSADKKLSARKADANESEMIGFAPTTALASGSESATSQ